MVSDQKSRDSGEFRLPVVKCVVLRVQSSVLRVWNLELEAGFGSHYDVSCLGKRQIENGDGYRCQARCVQMRGEAPAPHSDSFGKGGCRG